MKIWTKALLFLSLFCFLAPRLSSQDKGLRIAAASDLKFAMSVLATQYENQTGTKLDVTYGSSGNFFSQIQNGAPFDIFFSADIDYPKKLEAAGLTVPGTLHEYAVGHIVIWMPPEMQISLATQGWNALLDPRVTKIAIAKPEHAPYGRAAVAALKKAGIYDRVAAKFVYGENISQTAQFVQSGNAQAGIVALSLAISPAMKDGKRWDIPADLYPPIEQGVAVLKNAANQTAARAFLEFIKTGTARTILAQYGFAFPEPHLQGKP
jgi:molybdate transport system substrate-binding protein